MQTFATISQLQNSHKCTRRGSAARRETAESQESDMKYEASCQKVSMWSAAAGERRVIYSLRCLGGRTERDLSVVFQSERPGAAL